MLKIYLTEFWYEGKRYAGQNITAKSFDEAQKIANDLGLILVGELIKEFSLN